MLSAFVVCCMHSNAVQTRFFHGVFFSLKTMLGRSSLTWVYIVCNISYIIKSTVSYKEHQQTREADDKWLNNDSFEVKVKLCELQNSNLNLCVFCKTYV